MIVEDLEKREKKYVHPNGCDCPCDKWMLKVV